MQGVRVLGKVRCSEHGRVRSRISLDLSRERKKLIWKKLINELAARGKIEEFRISLQKRCSALDEESARSIQATNNNLTSIITERAIAVYSNIVIRDTVKLFQKTKDLIKKHQNMKASNPTDIIKLAELSKLISRRKVADRRKYNMETIAHALKNGGSLKAVKRKLGIGKIRCIP